MEFGEVVHAPPTLQYKNKKIEAAATQPDGQARLHEILYYQEVHFCKASGYIDIGLNLSFFYIFVLNFNFFLFILCFLSHHVCVLEFFL